MRMTRIGAVLASGVVVLGAMGIAAPVSAETGVWHQAFTRADAEATCAPPVNETPWQDTFRGQREWTPSWAQWANGGQGGWVCQRSIIWAQVPAASNDVCAFIGSVSAVDSYAILINGYAMPIGTVFYANSDCTDPTGVVTTFDAVYVASGGASEAEALCRAAFRLPQGGPNGRPNQWDCGL